MALVLDQLELQKADLHKQERPMLRLDHLTHHLHLVAVVVEAAAAAVVEVVAVVLHVAEVEGSPF